MKGPDKMVTVTKETFFATIGPLNVSPCNYNPDITFWEVVATREVVGRSYPGWRNGGLPESIQPRSYELRKSIVDRSHGRGQPKG